MRKNFFIKLLIFVIAFAVFNKGLNVFYEKAVLSSFFIFQTENEYQQSKGQKPVLIIGDSHSEEGIDTNILNNAINFSSSAESYLQNFYKLQASIQEAKGTIRVVILPYDIHSFNSKQTDRPITNRYYWKRYIDFSEVGIKTHKLSEYLQERFLAEFAYLEGDKAAFDILLSKINRTKEHHGYGIKKINPLFHNPNRNVVSIASRHFEGGKALDEVQIEYFLRILRLCEQNNISVVLIKFPVTEDYYEEASRYVDTEAYYGQLDNTIEEGGYKVFILNYQKLFFGKHLYFINSDHLNSFGAQAISEIIKADVSSILSLSSTY